jgi:long-chain acyl-CoA synthetase
MTEKTWLGAYPRGVPTEIDPDRYASLCELLESSFGRFGDAPAFTNLGTTLTFADTEVASRAFAAYLQSLPGLTRGDRVAVMLPNTLQSPVVLFGILRAGMIAVNVNPMYTVPELEHQLADSGAQAIVVLENFAGTVERALAHTQLKHVIVSRIGDHLPWPKSAVANFIVKHV